MNENKTNYTEFINKIKSFKSIDARDNYIKATIQPEEYIPFEVVSVLCDQILATSCFDKNGDIHIDSCKKYLNYMYVIYNSYLNIDVDSKNFLEQYNEIQKLGISDVLVGLIPANQMSTLDAILKMKSDDLITNNYEIHAFVRNELNKLYPAMASGITDFLKVINGVLENIDVNKAIEIIREA